MESIFQQLPGIEIAVAEIAQTLSRLWINPETTTTTPSAFRASQLNLVLQLGPTTTAQEAEQLFHILVTFAQRYPCRLILLCPTQDSKAVSKAKLFSQCYVGAAQHDSCCCEALMLQYLSDEPTYLQNQISVWLENDLPCYYWFHRVPASLIQEAYVAFLGYFERIIYDSSIDSAYETVKWPYRDRIRDMVFDRTLPIRQILGQFLSGYAPNVLITQLKHVRIQNSVQNLQLSRLLLDWQKQALMQCAFQIHQILKADFETITSETLKDSIQIEWLYENPANYCKCDISFEVNHIQIDTRFEGNAISRKSPFAQLMPVQLLIEALFFSPISLLHDTLN
jgi:hypothetical protein